jgi:hypothetical protein
VADVVKAVAFAVLLAGCDSCQPAVSPPPPPPTAQTIYAEIVEAGCLAPDPDGGIAAVQGEMALRPPPAWMQCLQDGGTVAACAVPCIK